MNIKRLLAFLLLSISITHLSAKAREISLENTNMICRLGVDLEGSRDSSTLIPNGKYGLDKNAGFEFTLGAEDKIRDYEFGLRQTVTLYNHGNGTFYNDIKIPYSAKTKNMGAETTITSFYKATKFFQPYIGIGIGINLSSYDDGGQSVDAKSYKPTIHTLVGFNSQLLGPIGIYVQYKYTIADSYTNQVAVNDGSGSLTLIQIEDKGVSGSKTLAGLSLVF